MTQADKCKLRLQTVAFSAFKSGAISEAKWRQILDLLCARTSIKVLQREIKEIAKV